MGKHAQRFLENHELYGDGIVDGGNMKEDIIRLLEEYVESHFILNKQGTMVQCPICKNKRFYCPKCDGRGYIPK